MPGQVGPAAGAVFRLGQVHGKAAPTAVCAGAVRAVDEQRLARALGVELRAVLVFFVAIPARATAHRQHLGNEVEIDGRKDRGLLVAALRVLAECGVGALTQTRIGRKGARYRSDRGQTVRTTGVSSRQVGRTALRDRQVIEVHLVVDVELLPIGAEQSAYPVVLVGGDAKLVALVLVLDCIHPLAHRGVALQLGGGGQRRARIGRRVEISGAGADATVK